MVRVLFFTLKTICILFVPQSSATNTAPPTGTQLIPVSASVPQSTCTTLNAIPLATPNQKTTWLVGRATRRQGQTDVNQNDCRINNFGSDCDAMQITITLGQDGQTRDVSLYAYNTRTDTVLHRAGKYLLLDSNYEVYREEAETKLFINREGAVLMAASPNQATTQSFDFAKVAESKDMTWALLASCDQTLAWVMFRADLLSNDPQATFVEHYRQSIDDTLRQFNINPSNLVEVKLAFPFPVPEIPGYDAVQQPSVVQMPTNNYAAAAPTPAAINPPPSQTVSYPSTVYVVYRSPPPPPPPTLAANPPIISSYPVPPPSSQTSQSAKKSAVYYAPASNIPSPPPPTLASVPAALPTYGTVPAPPQVQYSSPVTPPTFYAPSPTYGTLPALPPPSLPQPPTTSISPPAFVSIPPPSQYSPPVPAPVTYESFFSPPPPPTYIQYSPPATPPVIYPSTTAYEVVQPPPPPPLQPPPPAYASPPVYASPAISPPYVVYAPPPTPH